MRKSSRPAELQEKIHSLKQSFASLKQESRFNHALNLRFQQFEEETEASSLGLKGPEYVKKLQNFLKSSEKDQTVNLSMAKKEVEKFLVKWKGAALRCVNRVKSFIRQELINVASEKFETFPEIDFQQSLEELVENASSKSIGRVDKMLKELLDLKIENENRDLANFMAEIATPSRSEISKMIKRCSPSEIDALLKAKARGIVQNYEFETLQNVLVIRNHWNDAFEEAIKAIPQIINSEFLCKMERNIKPFLEQPLYKQELRIAYGENEHDSNDFDEELRINQEKAWISEIQELEKLKEKLMEAPKPDIHKEPQRIVNMPEIAMYEVFETNRREAERRRIAQEDDLNLTKEIIARENALFKKFQLDEDFKTWVRKLGQKGMENVQVIGKLHKALVIKEIQELQHKAHLERRLRREKAQKEHDILCNRRNSSDNAADELDEIEQGLSDLQSKILRSAEISESVRSQRDLVEEKLETEQWKSNAMKLVLAKHTGAREGAKAIWSPTDGKPVKCTLIEKLPEGMWVAKTPRFQFVGIEKDFIL